MILDALAEATYTPPPTPVPTVAAAPALPGDRTEKPSRATVSRIVRVAGTLTGRWGAFQRCVETRESRGNPGVVNASGHAGLYQFSVRWRHGLPHIVQRGLVRAGLPRASARAIRLALPARIEHWPAAMQRVGFAQVIHEGGPSAALRHWYLGGSACNALAGAR